MLRFDAVCKERRVLQGPALFLCLLLGACTSREAVTACAADVAGLEKRRVEQVIDGDTIYLAGGEKLRLVGVNTPELGRDGRPDEPLAQAARSALADELASGLVWLQEAADARDRHGRTLAYAFNGRGESISGLLISRGLGFHVAIAPNVAWADCLQRTEQAARSAALGVWSEPAFQALEAAELAPAQRGFARLRDRVTHVSFKDNGWWLQLGGKIGVRVGRDGQPGFSRGELRALDGRTVEVRGWLVPRDGGWWTMTLGHPSMLETVP